MRNEPRTTHTSVITRGLALYCIGVAAVCVLALDRPSRSIAVARHTNTLAFSSVELAKVRLHIHCITPFQIFGRLADPSPIGSVLATPTSKLASAKEKCKLKWHGMFKHDDEELSRSEFAKRLSKAPLSWPTYYVANRQPPFLVPEKQRHKFKIKGYLGHVALQSQRLENSSDVCATDEKAIVKQPLADEALDSVFMALSNEEEKLTVNHILAFIKYRSPLLQMVNWEVFIASLPVGPEDIPI
ncbi:hypothetical protein X943_003396 [Babesia divergens]|uniref:Uncharacterized protein n=1 Tax=Babesia divergens TaxID=32595 RepID=A0AAD9LIA8_BABDI|nr:hypothetical protein X943_003396 [Babesia divergens]